MFAVCLLRIYRWKNYEIKIKGEERRKRRDEIQKRNREGYTRTIETITRINETCLIERERERITQKSCSH